VREGLWLRKSARCGTPAVMRTAKRSVGQSRPQPEATMSVSQSTSVATILREHVTLEVESIDRMYLNGCHWVMLRPDRERCPEDANARR